MANKQRRAPNLAERSSITVDEVVTLLRDIAAYRDALARAHTVLMDWTNGSPEFAAAWDKFIASGGISGSDFRAFMKGQLRCRGSVRQRRHLRLIPGSTSI